MLDLASVKEVIIEAFHAAEDLLMAAVTMDFSDMRFDDEEEV